jgi:glycine/D-amino acid oxidase-like deaminating enzyme
LPASVVVLAMGPWSGQALKWFPSLRPVTGTRAHSVTMRPKDVSASPVMSHALFLDTVDADGCHQDPEVYPRGDGEVYMCGYADAEPLPDQPCAAPFDAKCCESLRDMAAGLSSWLAPDHVRYEKEQACFLPVSGKAGAASPDHDLPLIGAVPDCEGLYVATAHRCVCGFRVELLVFSCSVCVHHSCWGILLSTGTGLALSELIVDGAATSVDLAPFPTTVRK